MTEPNLDKVFVKEYDRMTRKLKTGATWHNQKVRFITHLFGKEYYWLEDGDGTMWLAKVGADGNPILV